MAEKDSGVSGGYVAKCVFGRVALHSWIQMDPDGVMRGMSIKVVYDQDGCVIEVVGPLPTGVEARYE